jgi:hypothetical protein
MMSDLCKAELLVRNPEAAELGSINHRWATEAKQRRNEVRSGTVKPVAAAEAFRKVRESLRR